MRRSGPTALADDGDMSVWLNAVTEVAQRTAEVAITYFDQARRSTLAVEFKPDGSPVTAADRAAESTAREWIERRFPHDGIVGEELGVVKPTASRRWFIDPIDGTKSFVRGVPLWGTLVAVAEGDTVLAGAICCLAAGEQLAAALGQGSWRNGVRCHVSQERRLERATVLSTEAVARVSSPRVASRGTRSRRSTGGRSGTQDVARRWRGWCRVAERAAVARTWGDAYGYVLVATGRAEVMVDAVMHPWDTAALAPIITEAGGVFTDWDGTPTALGGSSVATNAALADKVRALLKSRAG